MKDDPNNIKRLSAFEDWFRRSDLPPIISALAYRAWVAGAAWEEHQTTLCETRDGTQRGTQTKNRVDEIVGMR